MKKIKEILIDKNFYICIMIAFAFFGIFSKLEYATDTYTVFENSAQSTIQHFFASGRFVTGICQAAVRVLNFSNTFTYAISFTLALVCLSISIYKLFNIVIKDIKKWLVAMFVSLLIIINVFSIELFLYIEKGILIFSVLLCVLAFEKLIEYFKGNKKSIIWIFIYMTFANFSYQGTVALFVALSLTYIIKYSKDTKSFIKNNIVTALCYGIPALINYLIVKFIFVNNRIAGEFDLIQSITKIIQGTLQMLNTYKILPKYLFVILLGLLFIIIFYYIFKQRNDGKEKILSVLAVRLYCSRNYICNNITTTYASNIFCLVCTKK